MNFLFYLAAGLLAFVPSALALSPMIFASHDVIKVLAAAIAPVVYSISFSMVAGGLSLIGQRAIVPGKFPRDKSHPVYGPRRIFGFCWTAIYYFKPLYWFMLQIPILKKILFRSFGYRGSMNFTVYPDTWIRDLPILELGAGCYLANRATIGTNICLTDGSILVDRVKIGEKALVGHLSMVAPGSKLLDGAELGGGCAVGIRARMLEGSKVKPSASINHGAVIGQDCDVGAHTYIGLRTILRSKITVPEGSVVPSGMVFNTQDELDACLDEGTSNLKEQVQRLTSADMVASVLNAS